MLAWKNYIDKIECFIDERNNQEIDGGQKEKRVMVFLLLIPTL